MDAASTVRIPREVVNQADSSPDTTQVLPSSGQQRPLEQRSLEQRLNPEPRHGGWPAEDYGQEQLPPNPYQAKRGPNEFGPLGSQAQNYHQY
ncbi:hypothetical protein [Saccharopolyspora thermophila]|nr:hypothetical protein [Saccharopolyspora subtropica]